VPLAHELWFVDGVPERDWSFAAEGRTLLLLAAAVAVTLGVRLLARIRDGFDVPALARLVPWMPFAVRLHLAVSLVGLLAGGWYLAPSMELDGFVGVVLGVVAAVVAVLLVTGWHTREGALLLVAAGPLGMIEYGLGPVLQRVDLLGLAVFLLVAGPGRWSADFELRRAAEAGIAQLGQALWALRMGAGIALIAVAFTEKLANPALALHFLAEQDVNFNVLRFAGVGDTEFIRIAGAVEVLFGLLVISGALPQLIVLAAGIPFNLTLYFFGLIELLGHLPIYAAMLVLLVFGSHAELRPWCSRLVPVDAAPGRSYAAPG
jgi:hypothetical protein